ncbi:Inner membrane transport permease YbhS [Salinivirga cyanobacteriivorans]|uniref:Inner membrane transport permease YbhS n=1 Tax=Salinivirga cyanobacteriivorans TaxID=1307839 RepID=A0A0S2HX00_9BACT|nr:ABC transporter permease [Salinivirga cyanobacteriivorans]ALO14552.1 Inner membrane transport permease YbhS [Salinivirga cyanobacteriivorans]
MQTPNRSWIAVLRREIRRMASKRLYLLMTVVLPLLAFGFFIALFNQGKPTDLPVAVLDNDQTSLSRDLTETIDLTTTVNITDYATDLKEAKEGLKRGDFYAVVVIPDNFRKNIYRNQQPTVSNNYNNAYMVVGSLINSDVTKAVSTFSKGINLQSRLKHGQSKKAAMVAINPIAIDGHKLFNPYLNYFYYLATTFLPIMLLIFILMSTVYAIGSEYKQGTAGEWLKTANGSIIRALSGKLLPYALIWFTQMLFMNIVMFRFFHTPLNGEVWLIVLNAFLFVLAYMATGIFIAAIFPALRMGLSVASIYSALAFTFSGLTFPYIAMYKLVAFFGNLFPFSHYLQVFLDQSLRNAPISVTFEPLLYLNLFLLLPFVVMPKLKKMCLQPAYWGKL